MAVDWNHCRCLLADHRLAWRLSADWDAVHGVRPNDLSRTPRSAGGLPARRASSTTGRPALTLPSKRMLPAPAVAA